MYLAARPDAARHGSMAGSTMADWVRAIAPDGPLRSQRVHKVCCLTAVAVAIRFVEVESQVMMMQLTQSLLLPAADEALSFDEPRRRQLTTAPSIPRHRRT